MCALQASVNVAHTNSSIDLLLRKQRQYFHGGILLYRLKQGRVVYIITSIVLY